MCGPPVDIEKLRSSLRGLDRGRLLIVAERAIELVPRARLRLLLEGFLRVEPVAGGKRGTVPLLEEVKRFDETSRKGRYYESFHVDSHSFMRKSEGTEAFIAEFDRLAGKCVKAAGKAPDGALREAFGLLFGLLRRIDEGRDDIVFFADEGGSWQVSVDWRVALPAYFRCLAKCASPEEFAREVEGAIADFDDYDRPRQIAAARRVASREQKLALGRLRAGKKRP